MPVGNEYVKRTDYDQPPAPTPDQLLNRPGVYQPGVNGPGYLDHFIHRGLVDLFPNLLDQPGRGWLRTLELLEHDAHHHPEWVVDLRHAADLALAAGRIDYSYFTRLYRR